MFKKVLLSVIIIGLVSCNLLNDPEPKQAIPVEKGLDSIENYQGILSGVYNNLQNNSPQFVDLNDIITADVSWGGTFFRFTQVAKQNITVYNSLIETLWNNAYEAINGTNIIINKVDKVKNATQSKIDDIRGQALFIRALEYYYLVQYFAKPWGATMDNSQMGVPLKLKPVTKSNDFKNIKRASVQAIYDQILSDLKGAEKLISNTVPNRATNYATTALRARIALIQRRWSDAADLAAEVIPNYKLSDDVTKYFRDELSDESIFEVQNTIEDTPGTGNTALTAVYNIAARNDAHLTDAYKTALKNIVTDDQETALSAANQKAIDTRVTQLLATNTEPPLKINDYTNTDKYEDVTNQADNVPILRLSEMILTRAEALAEIKGVSQEPIDLLNEIRTRAIKVVTANGKPGNEKLIEYKVDDFSNKQELIDAILLERRVELSFEGHRKTDLQRRKLDVRGTSWNANKLVFPIPQSQIDASNIKQNDGY